MGKLLENKVLVIESEHSFYYTNQKYIPIDYVIKSLKALEKNFNDTSKFIEESYPNFKVTNSEIYIKQLESGSLDVKFIVIKTLESSEKLLEKAKDASKHLIPTKEDVKDIVKNSFYVLLGHGLGLLSPSEPVQQINNYYVHQNLSEEQVEKILVKLSDKQLANNALDIANPAKLEKEAVLQTYENNIDEAETLIDRETIDDLPDVYEPETPPDKEKFIKDVKLSIHASDKDRPLQGWAGSINALDVRRTTIKLHESVDATKLHGQTNVIADVIVHEKFNLKKRKYEINFIEVLSYTSIKK